MSENRKMCSGKVGQREQEDGPVSEVACAKREFCLLKTLMVEGER